ncbi:MAG: DNA-binding protein [Dissulfuribacterales bacterium]
MNLKILFTLCSALSVSLLLAGCEGQMPSKKTEAPKDKKTVEQANPPGKPASSEPTITGKIKETMNSAGYTYVLLEKDGVQTWAALPETQVQTGQEITIYSGMEMKNFKSNTLNRTFDSIIFSSGIAGAASDKKPTQSGSLDIKPSAPGAAEVATTPPAFGVQKTEKTPEQMAMEAHSTAKRIDPLKFLGKKIDKAAGENSYVIADMHAKAKELAGKTVQVKGMVTKVSSGIMGKNWVHIQDGSGAQDAQNFDMTVTTQAQPKEGDIVTFEGVLAADKDFGAGYRYDVIIEDAKLKQ